LFESKGRSTSISSSLIATALAQASMITAINGQRPLTRVAACFVFKSSGISGRIQDPDPAPTGLKLEFDEIIAATKAYAFFLDPDVRDSLSALIPGFQCVALDDGVVYGIDSHILPQLDGLRTLRGDNRTIEPLLAFLDQRQAAYAVRRDNQTSVGAEGIILRGDTALPPLQSPRTRKRG
jgi:hypothetical protein